MRAAPKRFRLSLGKVLVFVFFLFVLLGKWWAPLGDHQSSTLHFLLNPVFSFSNAIWRPFENVWQIYFNLLELKKENAELKKEKSEYLKHLTELEGQLQSFTAIKSIQDSFQKSDFHLHWAEVIAFDPVDPTLGIWINQGSENSIQSGQVVISGEGLVGVVSKVLPRSSKVIPLMSPHSIVDAEIAESGVRGVLKGEHKVLELDRHYWTSRMEYLGNAEKIEPGELVISSGLDKVFPRGLIIGKIQNLIKDERGLFVSAEVLPEVDFTKLRIVAVLIP